MAKQQQVTVVYTDDVSGESLESDAVTTVDFSLLGTSYEIDLSEANVTALRDDLATWIAHARKVTSPRRGGARPSAPRAAKAGTTDRDQNQAVREWAREQGHQVSERGRISATIMDAYQAAH